MKHTFHVAKPSRAEEDYFVGLQIETRRQIALQRELHLEAEAREWARDLHFMRCPKCGMQLEEITYRDVRIDKCFHCQGLWLDAGELEAVSRKESGFIGALMKAFRSGAAA